MALWLSTLLAGAGIGACVTQQQNAARSGKAGVEQIGGDPFSTAANAAPTPPYAATGEPIVRAVQRAAPAIVSIDTTARVGYRVFEDPFDQFLGRGGRDVIREVPTGAGSGVLLAGGYVLTNEHVVSEAVRSGGRIRITRSDGHTHSASAVGADRASDIAVLKVTNPAGLPAAPLGAEDTLLPGQTVIAIGNPVGLSASVSAGVVSALGRPLTMEDRTYENLIQTDTAINPGNSGGALIDLGGRVVGINTLVRADAQNIGFAIPIKTALRIADELKRHGKVRRPSTGIIPMDITPRVARFLSLPEGAQGVVVRGVYRRSPAAEAGLQQGDVIVEMAGAKIADEAAYRKTLAGLKIGQEAAITILRGGKRASVRLRLAEAE